MRKSFLIILTVLLVLGLGGYATATQPLTTDDAATQGFKNVKVETGVTYGERGSFNVTEIPTVISYGIANKIDFIFTVPYVITKLEDISEVGFSDITLQMKVRLYEGFVNLAMKPGFTLPTGDQNKGLGYGEVTYGTTFIVSKQIDSLALNANVKYTRTNNDINETVLLGLISAEYPILDSLKLVGEVGVSDYSSTVLWNGGLVYAVAKAVELSASYGQTDCGNNGCGVNDLDWKLKSGLTWRF